MKHESISEARRGGTRPKVFFFANGRGQAHAIRAMEIAGEVEGLGSNASFTFVSYGAGTETFRARGEDVVDLGIPETSPMWATLIASGRLMSDARPDLVVSCEEFVVLPVAKMMGIPTVFVGEWFLNPRAPLMQALALADEIIFTEDPGIFEEPPYVKGKVFYSGPLLRKFNYTGGERERARQDLRLPADATVVAVLTSGWATEENEPICHVLVPAFDSLRAPGRLMIWIAGRDYELLRRRLGERPDVVIKRLVSRFGAHERTGADGPIQGGERHFLGLGHLAKRRDRLPARGRRVSHLDSKTTPGNASPAPACRRRGLSRSRLGGTRGGLRHFLS